MHKEEDELRVKMFEVIIDRLEILWLTTNPEIGKELLEKKKAGTIDKDKDMEGITPNNFKQFWTEYTKIIPTTLKLPDEIAAKVESRKFILPKFSRDQLRKRTLGIEIEHKE